MSQDEFELRFLSDDELEMVSMEGETTLYRRARPWAPSLDELSTFTGRYESDELGTVFQVEVEEDGLVARIEHAPAQLVELTSVERDTFTVGMMLFRFRRDAADGVVALDYGNPVVRSLRFTRLADGT